MTTRLIPLSFCLRSCRLMPWLSWLLRIRRSTWPEEDNTAHLNMTQWSHMDSMEWHNYVWGQTWPLLHQNFSYTKTLAKPQPTAAVWQGKPATANQCEAIKQPHFFAINLICQHQWGERGFHLVLIGTKTVCGVVVGTRVTSSYFHAPRSHVSHAVAVRADSNLTPTHLRHNNSHKTILTVLAIFNPKTLQALWEPWSQTW